MSLYLKALGYHVYLATTNDSYVNNSKNIEANAKALNALKSTLNDDYLSRVSNVDSAFVAWNIITSLGEKDLYYAGSDSDVGSLTSNIRVAPRIVLFLFAKEDYSIPNYKSRIKISNPR